MFCSLDTHTQHTHTRVLVMCFYAKHLQNYRNILAKNIHVALNPPQLDNIDCKDPKMKENGKSQELDNINCTSVLLR